MCGYDFVQLVKIDWNKTYNCQVKICLPSFFTGHPENPAAQITKTFYKQHREHRNIIRDIFLRQTWNVIHFQLA